MRSRLARLWSIVIGSLARATRRPRHGRFPTLERLEERAVPASLVGCTCPHCTGAAAYSLGGGVPGTSPYALKWSQPSGLGAPVTITYSYSNLLDGRLGGGLSAATIKAAVEEALGRWAAVAPLRFVERPDAGPAPSTADYDATGKPMLRFGHRPIDGGYGVLAYGYYPGYSGLAGDIQLDSGDSWSVNPATGQDLLEVALHEIGHALGLAHSNVSTSIMDATYSGYFHGLGTSYLYADDIAGVRALYGAGVGSVTPYAPAPPTPFTVVGTTLYVRGTAGNDTLAFNGGTSKVTLNGLTYAGNLSAVRAVVFDGGSGSDRAAVVGSSLAETFALRAGQLSMAGAVWNLSIVNTEWIDTTAGSGDRVTLTGTTGNDTFLAQPTAAQLTWGGYTVIARGFASVRAVGGGGVDAAYLHGSTGNDTLTGGATSTRLQGSGYSLLAEGFRTAYAYGRGGSDTATLTDTAGNDLFASSPGFAAIQGPGSSFVVAAYNFARVQALASGGVDVARLFGGTGANTLVATATYTALQAGAERWEARNFEQVYADGQGGTDVAYLYDSAGNDSFTSLGRTGTLAYPSAAVQFVNFGQAVVYGTSGGVNRRQTNTLGFTVDWTGSWV